MWADRHQPKKLKDFSFHESINQKLHRLTQKDSFPHLLVYGPPGSGRRSRILAVLCEIFGPSASHLVPTTHEYKVSATKRELNILASPHHIEVSPSEAGNHDKVVIQELIRNSAQTKAVSGKFKVVVVDQADHLTMAAQQALRRTMERYAASCRIILVAESASRVIPAIRSRCLGVRVPAPPEFKIKELLGAVGRQEHVKFDTLALDNIVQASHRNVRRALLLFQATAVRNHNTLPPNADLPFPEWELLVSEIVGMIERGSTSKDVMAIRKKMVNLLNKCIPAEMILQELVDKLLARMASMTPSGHFMAAAGLHRAKFDLVYYATLFDGRMRKGTQPLIHLEAYVTRAMLIIGRAKSMR
eukprot:gnl/Dysnectes_brevis/3899_a5053_822.p1 GENE.gnl/Dysnectes_brevis/3899_a5053_822~~gnl/Dysnectes_brevis/3899_a5053_822.p1  ORF type:complete len:359 (+),score=97.95 gnl/Dysnectes_brevis/3899_a5053_822:939-2015(+)